MPDPMTDMPDVKAGPALSATTDVPVVTEAPAEPVAEPVDEPAKPADTSETAETPAGEADTPPQGETQEGGEEGDKTSPQQRAAFARERNRRQALEARITAQEQQIADLIKTVANQQPKAEPPKPEPRPQRLDYNSPDAFEDALVEWKAKEVRTQTEAQVRQAIQREQLQATAQEVAATHEQREMAFAEEHGDYMDLTRDPTATFFTDVMVGAAIQIEEGPEVLYHLAQHPEEGKRIAAMLPGRQAAEIGKLAAKLTAPTPEPVVRAKPTPIRPISGRSGEVERSLDEMSMDEWHAKRSAERKAAGIKVF